MAAASSAKPCETQGNGCQTWDKAEFLDPASPYPWRRWEFNRVTPNKPCRCTLLFRAKDKSGNVQPDHHDENYGSYVIDHLLPIEVFVGEVYESKIPNDPDSHFDAEDSAWQQSRVARASGGPRCQKRAG